MYAEEDLLPISALQHLAFCERQWALIHLEQQWRDNVLTVEGHHLHERVHDPDASEHRGDGHMARSLRLRSFRLGLVGQADVVVFENGPSGPETPHIIEYKHGRPKSDRSDEVQLCAQALCLEEMLGIPMASGDFFYGKPRRRHQVFFSEALRHETIRLAARLHELSDAGQTPPAVATAACAQCSLIDLCLPKVTGGRKSAARYLRLMVTSLEDNPEEGSA